MKALLKMDPKERLTCGEAMKHPYFEDVVEKGGCGGEGVSEKMKEDRGGLAIRTKTREKRADLE